jgi:flagellar motor protein MotB
VLLLLCFFVLWHISDKQRAVTAARATPSIPTEVEEPTSPADAPQLLTLQSIADTTSRSSDVQGQPQGGTNLATASPPEIRNPQSAIRNPDAAPVSNEQPEPAPLPFAPEQPSVTLDSVTHSGWQNMQAEIDRYIREHNLDRAVGVVSTEHELVVLLGDTITFPSGQATLSPAVAPLLVRVAALAAEQPELSLEISGHTDDRPIATTEFPSNWELSTARASRVARALLEEGRIDPVRISTRGYAHYRPLYPNDSEAQRAANRRVEIRFFRQVG